MGVEGKRLLVLGAGRGQIGLYKAAKEMRLNIKTHINKDNKLVASLSISAPTNETLREIMCELVGAGGDKLAVFVTSETLDAIGKKIVDLRPFVFSVANQLGISVSTRYDKQKDELMIIKTGVAKR